jgi:hypothetical protein
VKFFIRTAFGDIPYNYFKQTSHVLLFFLCLQELKEDVFDILALWATLFAGNPENEVTKTDDLMSRI